MTCHVPGRFDEALVDLARGVTLPPGTVAAVRSHIDFCEACAHRFAREQALSTGLRALAAGLAEVSAPGAMEQRLLNAFAAHHATTTRTRTVSVTWLAAAAAMLMIAGVGAWAAWIAGGSQAPIAGRVDSAATAASEHALDDFVLLPAAIGLPALESGRIVRVDLPVTSLPAYGVQMIPDATRNDVQADLLVGQDGQPRAIRLVRATEQH